MYFEYNKICIISQYFTILLEKNHIMISILKIVYIYNNIINKNKHTIFCVNTKIDTSVKNYYIQLKYFIMTHDLLPICFKILVSLC